MIGGPEHTTVHRVETAKEAFMEDVKKEKAEALTEDCSMEDLGPMPADLFMELLEWMSEMEIQADEEAVTDIKSIREALGYTRTTGTLWQLM